MAEPESPPSLLGNFSVLAGAHALGLVVPLLTVPYLARVLHPEGWAPVLLAQAVASWIVLLLDYGFDLSATRAVAHARATNLDLRTIVWGVQGAKLVLLPIALLLLLTACGVLPLLRGAPLLAFSMSAYALLRGLNPLWFFQGLERVRSAIVIDTGARIAGAAGVFLCVRTPDDGWKVLALQAVFAGVSLALLMLRLQHRIPPMWSRHAVQAALRDSWTMFVFRASSTLYMQGNTIILGLFATPLAVAAYGGAERIVRAAINLLEPVTRLFLPRISFLAGGNKGEAHRLIRTLLITLGTGSALGGALIALAAPLLVRTLLGPGYDGAIPVLRWLSLLVPVIAFGTVLGNFWALPFKRERALLIATMVAGAANLALAWALVPAMAALGMTAAVVVAESIVAIALAVLYWRWRHADAPHTPALG